MVSIEDALNAGHVVLPARETHDAAMAPAIARGRDDVQADPLQHLENSQYACPICLTRTRVICYHLR